MSYQMPLQEARDRISRIKGYIAYHRKERQPHYGLTQPELDKLIESWGHDPKLGKGIGRQLDPSPFLASLTERDTTKTGAIAPTFEDEL